MPVPVLIPQLLDDHLCPGGEMKDDTKGIILVTNTQYIFLIIVEYIDVHVQGKKWLLAMALAMWQLFPDLGHHGAGKGGCHRPRPLPGYPSGA